MPPRPNPFYALVLLAGAAFTITACAYGWMTYLSTQRPTPAAAAVASQSTLLPFLREHGSRLLFVELAVLSLASVAALATDRLRSDNLRR
jgi:hypothetical protein